MTNYRWRAVLTYQIGGFPKITAYGREPLAASGRLREALMRLGVFSDAGNGMLRYSGRVTVQLKDGTKAEVGQDGFCKIDPGMVDKKHYPGGLPDCFVEARDA